MERVPTEIWHEILKNPSLSMGEIKQFSCVSRTFRELARPRLYEKVVLEGYVSHSPDDAGSWSAKQHLDRLRWVIRMLESTLEKARGLQVRGLAPFIRVLWLFEWRIPVLMDIDRQGCRGLGPITQGDVPPIVDTEVQPKTPDSIPLALEMLQERYDDIIEAIKEYSPRCAVFQRVTITQRIQDTILCKPTLESVEFKCCPVKLPLLETLKLRPIAATFSSLRVITQSVNPSCFAFSPQEEESMKVYFRYLVFYTWERLRSLRIRADFLPKFAFDSKGPFVGLPSLEVLEICPSDGEWYWETIQVLLASPKLRTFIFQPFDANAAKDYFEIGPSHQQNLALHQFQALSFILPNLTSITACGQLFKYLPLTGKAIKEATFLILSREEMIGGNQIGFENSEEDLNTLWDDLRGCVLQLRDSTGPLTHFSIKRIANAAPKEFLMPIELLQFMSACLSHVVELHVPQLDDINYGNFEDDETFPTLLEELQTFPKLQRVAIQHIEHKCHALSLYDDDNIVSWTFPPDDWKPCDEDGYYFDEKIHPSLTVVWLGRCFFWRWEETMWKEYRCK